MMTDLPEGQTQYDKENASGQCASTAGLGWVSAETKPADHKPVAVIVDGERYKYWARAMWVPKFTLEDSSDEYDFGEYNEADDTTYWPEGWYEWNHAEETHWLISEPVILWAAVEVPNAEITGSALLRSPG